jgi:hypothetical protein
MVEEQVTCGIGGVAAARSGWLGGFRVQLLGYPQAYFASAYHVDVGAGASLPVKRGP